MPVLPRALLLCCLTFIVVIACAPASVPSDRAPNAVAPPAAPSTEPARTGPRRVTIATSGEVTSLATKFEVANFLSGDFHRISNASLAILDPAGVARPYLAVELPSREAGTWLVNPDGTMSTTWKLRTHAKWHDGQPVRARDFAFAFKVYMDESMPVRDRQPERLMERVEVLDNTAFVIYWKQTYPWANALVPQELEPLPEHILGPLYDAGNPEAFRNSGFWTTPAYVSTGAYRLVAWEHGSELRYLAFDDFFLGRPSIDEVLIRIIADTNTIVANLLAGTVDTLGNVMLGAQAIEAVRGRWQQTGEGQIHVSPSGYRYMQIQLDPTRVGPHALLDVRVRRAIVQGIDRAALADLVTDGLGSVAEVPVSPRDADFPRVEQAIARYPYDVSRALAQLQDAGWTRSPSGSLVDASGQPFTLELRAPQSTEGQREASILAADLTKLGMNVAQHTIPAARISDFEYRVTFPGLGATSRRIENPGSLDIGLTEQCGSAERRFRGLNRGCWMNPEYDRLYLTAFSSLDPNERGNAVAQAWKILTEDVGIFGLYHEVMTMPVRRGLVGAGARWPAQSGVTWNIYEWRWE